jgi:hypothetical protein
MFAPVIMASELRIQTVLLMEAQVALVAIQVITYSRILVSKMCVLAIMALELLIQTVLQMEILFVPHAIQATI